MFRLLLDHNFNQRIFRQVLRRVPDLDYVTAEELGLARSADPVILERAASENRIVLTHDAATMIDFAEERLVAGLPLPGVVVIHKEIPVGQAVEWLEIFLRCSEPEEWNGQVIWLRL
jgi:predicted nuclease of predicted toxin-antitoxin system